MRVATIGLASALATSFGCGMVHPGAPAAPDAASRATLARVYFWRAKPGKLDEYTRYVREVAEPIDHAAQRTGAFLSVTTYLASDSTVPWTHMRVFLLRDSTQLRGLSAALDEAGARIQPDSALRRKQSEYASTLRDGLGGTVVEIVP